MGITEPRATDLPPPPPPPPSPRPTYLLSRWLFLRLLGVVYLIAFVSLAADHRSRGRARHPSGPDLPRAGTRLVRRRRLPAVPHAVLARRRGGRHAAGAVLGRRSAGAPRRGRRRPGTGARAAVAALSVDERRGADVPLVPMGRAAARGGPARGVLCAHRSRAEPAPRAGSVRADALGRVGAAVPPDVPLPNHP